MDMNKVTKVMSVHPIYVIRGGRKKRSSKSNFGGDAMEALMNIGSEGAGSLVNDLADKAGEAINKKINKEPSDSGEDYYTEAQEGGQAVNEGGDTTTTLPPNKFPVAISKPKPTFEKANPINKEMIPFAEMEKNRLALGGQADFISDDVYKGVVIGAIAIGIVFLAIITKKVGKQN